MPIALLQIKFTDEERALLRRRAAKLDMSEADVLRVAMIMDAVMDGDAGAVRLVGSRLREKVGRRVAELCGFESAPSKA